MLELLAGLVMGVIFGFVLGTLFFLKNSNALPALKVIISEIEKTKRGLAETGEEVADEVKEAMVQLTGKIKTQMEASGLEAYVNKVVKLVEKQIDKLS